MDLQFNKNNQIIFIHINKEVNVEQNVRGMYKNITEIILIRGPSNKEWDFLHSLNICVRIKLKVTTIIEQHLSNSEIEPMFL